MLSISNTGGPSRRVLPLVAVLLALALAPACAKKDEAGKPSGVAPLGSSEPSSPTQASPTQAPPMMPPPSPHPAVGEAPPAADPNASISGEIVVAPAQRASVKPTDTIFLVARRISDNPSARGSLVAVKKLSAASFPIAFSLSAADMPFDNGAFEGDLTLTVRADKDGDPMTHRKGDAFGALPKVRVGARNVKLVIDQTQKEDESLAQPGAMPPPGHAQFPPGHPALPPGHP